MTPKLTRAEYRAAALRIDEQFQQDLATLQDQRDSAEITDGGYWAKRDIVMQAWINALKALGEMPEESN